MNYIKELNAFDDTLVFNPLSGSAIAVWHALMHFNNKSGWQTTFTVPASMLEVHSGIKGTTFKRARTELSEKGHIHVTPGSGNQAPTYRMLSQIKSFTEPVAATAATQPNPSDQSDAHPAEDPAAEQENQQANQNRPAPDDTADYTAAHTTTATVQTSTTNHATDKAPVRSHDRHPVHIPGHNLDRNTDDNPVHSAAPLIKQDLNQTQTKQNPTTTTTMAAGFYQQHFDTASPYILDDIQHWISHMSDPLVLDAMKRALEQNKPTWRYVKGILKSWQTKGIQTVEAAAADDQQFRSKHSQKPISRHSEKAEVIPAWFQERKQTHDQAQNTTTQNNTTLNQAEWEECERLLTKYGKKKQHTVPGT
ncbi:hypothetical protein GCM10028778_17950 [Barrientosiimonas marina]|uniref:DnaD domain protein n=1 Tax=Lentibacillus kimchii TaxID=1542911 RepID=A0ABW2UWL0_9BACI